MSEIVNGIGQFANNIINIISGTLNADTIEGILAVGAIAIIISILEGNTKVGLPKLPRRRRDDDDEDDYEYIRVRRQRK